VSTATAISDRFTIVESRVAVGADVRDCGPSASLATWFPTVKSHSGVFGCGANANQRLPHGDVAISRIHRWTHGKGGF
jgi:hypothetical protein